MLHDYSVPEWAMDEEYDHCQSLTEMKILRIVLTWLLFVNQRYTKNTLLKYNTYDSTKRGCIRRLDFRVQNAYEKLADLIPDDKDPAHLVSYAFEVWKNRGIYHKLKYHDLGERSGVAYPSLKFLYSNAEVLVKDWVLIPKYRSTGFVSAEDMKKRDIQIIENKVKRWCATYDKTPVDYWTDPKALYGLNPAYLKCSTSAQENRKEIEAYWGTTVEHLVEVLERIGIALERYQDNTYMALKERNKKRRELGLEPEYDHLDMLEYE